ncbi:transketolase C-terminal domain-containing protein, partial [Endozoicomonas sp. ONNA2]|uniref:transketolase C-terminal domain-containing protein n=1 Tax=Endozoicomonas sp. ONNA2 TaxID=2828741 RepID=UPI0027D23D48
VMTPGDENETRQLLSTGFLYDGPASVRYPRGTGPGAEICPDLLPLPVGKGEIRRTGSRVALLVFGTLLGNALAAAESLDATVANMRFVKPLDETLVKELAANHELLVTLEEGCIAGGAGSGVMEYLQRQEVNVPVLNLGIADTYIEAASHREQLAQCGLDTAGIIRSVRDRMERIERQSFHLGMAATGAREAVRE